MKAVKINFTDFWPGFNPSNNYLYNTLSKYFTLELSNEPEYLFFSCYSNLHLQYNCTKIQFLAENKRPDFRLADYALSFDYLQDDRHLRLPLYVFYFDEEYTVEKLLRPKTDAEIQQLLDEKRKFCCLLVSNPKALERIDFFKKLSTYKKVDSGGRVLNNIGGPVKNKLAFTKNYKFVIAFENSSYPGYTTEKVLEPKQVDAVPVYWGNPLIGQEMNTKSFINFHETGSFEQLMEQVIEADRQEDKYIEYLREPLFKGYRPNEYFDETRLVQFFEKVLSAGTQKNVSASNAYRLLKTKEITAGLIAKIKHRLW